MELNIHSYSILPNKRFSKKPSEVLGMFCLLPRCLEEIVPFNVFVKKAQNKQNLINRTFDKF